MQKYEVSFAHTINMTDIHTTEVVEAANICDAIMMATAVRLHQRPNNIACYGPQGDSRVAKVVELYQPKPERILHFVALS